MHERLRHSNGTHLESFVEDYLKAISGKTIRFEREVKYSIGEVIWWDVTFEPTYHDNGGVIGVSYNATNITERKLYEQQILAQNDSLKHIAHIQSHELRKPVASILGLVHLFKNEQYKATKEELMMLEKAASELDQKIRAIVRFTD